MELLEPHGGALDDILMLLDRTPATLRTLLGGLSPNWLQKNEGGNSWTAFEVLLHLIDCEHTNWLPRARSIRASDLPQPFPPFSRRAGSDEEKEKPISDLLDDFREIRARNIEEVKSWNLRGSDLERQALHPVFGAVTLGQLLATWATHDLTHLHQITRILAYQQREAVGPWIKFLGVLHCNGHGE